ncbi:MAG: carbon-nitrogen hydrolase family protein [Pseudohongiellaceae bacterium]|nr:carbon-nitrogen hydrolase family protein [Pseudohongiellaceae bacterium]
MNNKVAVVQMVSGADIHENLKSAQRLLAQAAEAGAGLVLLPENFAVLDGGPLAQFAEAQFDENALMQNMIGGCAKEYGIYIVAGTMPLATRPAVDGHIEPVPAPKVRPACLVFDNQGKQLARYDKIHLFDVQVDDKQAQYSESLSFEPGDSPQCIATPFGTLGLSICYDLRFPELYRQLCDEGAEILTVPSAFTQVTGEAHWEVLLRARAIENQCYVLAANQGGVHNESRETFGHSMIIDPWGRVLARVEKGEGIALADIDLKALYDLRERMPVHEHRRIS